MKISSFLTSKGCTVAVLLFINFCTVSSNVCVPLFDSCNDDCDCCGHDFNKNIRCELRNQGLGKRCYETLYIGQPCSVNSQCVSQNCVNNICRPNFGPRVNNPFCPLDDGPDDIVGPVDGSLPTCACPQGPTQDATFVLDRDLSTDYVNYNSQDFSGFIVEPTFNYPLRKMEVCSSSANPENDPMCYRIEGKCKNDNGFTLLKEGGIPFGNTRRSCVTVPVNGRQSYTDYRIGFGCRRGGYNNDCTCQANCDEIPSGQIPGCTSCNEEDANAFNPLSLVPTYPQYDSATDTTKFLYSFENKPDCQTSAPTTSAPTNRAPTTSAPTNRAPTTSAPTNRAPTTSAPTNRAPTTSAPTNRAPTTSAPTNRAPTTSAPTNRAPTTSAPTTSSPTTSSPTTRSPTTRAPTTRAPTTRAPTTRAPTTRAPTTRAPTTRAPTTRAPTTRAPTTSAPTTSAPTPKSSKKGKGKTYAPATKSPKKGKAKTYAPATKAPKKGKAKTYSPTVAKSAKKQRMLVNPDTCLPLSHPVIQWQGKCCFDTSGFKVFAPPYSNEQFTATVLLNNPDHTTGMKGVLFDGPYNFDGLYFFQIVVKGKFTETALVDYALSGGPGTLSRYGKVQGPKCDCESQGSSRLKSFFSKVRKLDNTCTDYPVILSEVKLMGNCNEGSHRITTT